MAYISEIKPVLAKMVAAGMPALLVGAPGVGKSAVVEEVAADLGCDMILSHPVVSDPTDVKGFGFPSEDKTHARFLPFGDLARALRATGPTVWMLDDLGQASPAVQAAFMQLLLARRVGEHMLPSCVSFVAATNRRGDRAGVSGILTPVKSRFASIVEVEVDYASWREWALAHDVPALLISFLEFRPDLLHKFDPVLHGRDLANFPCPRTWEHAGKLLRLGLTDAQFALAAQGAVGEEASVALITYIKMMKANLPSPAAVLSAPDAAPVPEAPEILWALTTALVRLVTEKSMDGFCRYAEILHEHAKGEFGARMVLELNRLKNKLTETAAWTRFCTSEAGAALLAR